MPDPTLDQRRRFAWEHYDCNPDDGGCTRKTNRRCVDATTGKERHPHACRLRRADDYFAGQASKQAELEDLGTQLTQLSADLATAREGAALVPGLRDRVKALETQVEMAEQRLGNLQGDLDLANTATQAAQRLYADLRREFDTHMATVHPVTPPPPAPTVTLFGAGGGNKDRTKDGIDVDRWYGNASDVAKAITRAKLNQSAGILTWLSFKLPESWDGMARGLGDAWVKDLYAKLDALGFPVWVAFHHEPEGDGVMPDWTKMQDRLSRMVPGGTAGNIKFWLIVTGWHQEEGTTAANKWDALYPKGAPIYGIAYDQPYPQYGAVWKDGVKTAEFRNGARTEGAVYVGHIARRAAQFGVKAAIAEYGYSDEHWALDPAWLDRTLASAKAKGLLAMAYFDTTLNSTKSWYLGAATSAKRKYYDSATKAARLTG